MSAELTRPQRRWLTQAVEVAAPLKLPASTADALFANDFVEPFGDSGLWVATEKARTLVAGWQRKAALDDATADLPSGSYNYAKRIVGWLEVLNQIDYGKSYSYTLARHAHVVAELRFARRDPLPSEEVHGDWHDWIVAQVDTAITCLADFDAEQEIAGTGGTVNVTFEAARATIPIPAARAALDAEADDGTVSLASYRHRRPAPSSGPTGSAA